MVSNGKTIDERTVLEMGPTSMLPQLPSSPILQPSPPTQLNEMTERIVPQRKKRKTDSKLQSKTTDYSVEEAFSVIKKNMIKIEKDKIPNDESDQDNEAFTTLRIKSMDELQSDSEDESADNVTQPQNSLLKHPPTRLLDFGPGVYLPQHRMQHVPIVPPKISHTNRQQLCFHCKSYGHGRMDCKNQWHHWWPKEYLEQNPWLRRKVHGSHELRKRGYWYFRQFHAQLEDEATDREWNDEPKRKVPTKRHYNMFKQPQKPINRFETTFPKVIHRLPQIQTVSCKVSSKVVEQGTKPLKSPTDFGNPLDIFERLQAQIEELKKSLEELKMHQDPKK